MQSTRIGNFEVHRVAEFEGPFFPPAEFFPDFDPEIVWANADLLGPRLIEWNFVASSRERLDRARDAWKAQRFPRIPGDDQEFIPWPDDHR